MYAILILCFLTLLNVSFCQEECTADEDKEWSYHYPPTDPSQWSTLFVDNCGGKMQSPIDIVTKSAASNGGSVKILYGDPIKSATMENTGSTIKITPKDGDVRQIKYGEPFDLQQIHFHWGSGDSPGSEHTLDGKRYDMEVHFVHYNKLYSAYANLAVFVKVGDSSNPVFQTISDAVGSVKHQDDSTEIQNWDLRQLLPESKNGEKVYHYGGSLTTPPCQGPVFWFVLSTPIDISAEQYASFHDIYTVKDDDPNCKMDGNFRPTQSIEGRDVMKMTLF